MADETPFIPTELQERILEALKQKALTLDALAQKLKTERSTLHRDGIKELMIEEKIANNRRVGGYYRPDAPPPKYAAHLGIESG
jgi:DeoR/GlpR family transcriptional regulator of sugar metabolism